MSVNITSVPDHVFVPTWCQPYFKFQGYRSNFNSFFATYKPPCAPLFWGALELGRHFWRLSIFNSLYLFTRKSYMEKPKSQINNAWAWCDPETMVIAPHWAIRMNNRRVYNCANRRTWQVYGCGRSANVANKGLRETSPLNLCFQPVHRCPISIWECVRIRPGVYVIIFPVIT